ncbi:MFS transporter [Clostridiaceae bacterium M8S5]|nr:MFS transporter [Clostridiaceae bacterium M8S5]
MNGYKEIKEDVQIWKFCFYGFFKNLKFFEPYLIIYLISMKLNLFQIGILFSMREGITYIFEVPSGIIADHYGKKRELLMCFVFYIISFVFLFLGINLICLSIGMIFFGLGEAFRSGTHKAMILSYLEHKGWFEHKGYVYGRTRSYSLLGSSISSFLSILLVLNLPALKWIFLISILPYILDFILIMSYPEFLDERKHTEKNIKTFYKTSVKHLKSIACNQIIRKIMLSAAFYDGVFKTIKDYIQPILQSLILAAGAGSIMSLEANQSLKVYLGIIYSIFYIFSSIVSKNIYRLTTRLNARFVFEKMFGLMGFLLIIISFSIYQEHLFLAISIYFILYLMMNARRAVFVDISSDYMDKSQRVTVLSIESQIRSILMVIMAPTFGWIADKFSISVLFLGIGVVLLLISRLFKIIPKRVSASEK